jgi:hypothetical protein
LEARQNILRCTGRTQEHLVSLDPASLGLGPASLWTISSNPVPGRLGYGMANIRLISGIVKVEKAAHQEHVGACKR